MNLSKLVLLSILILSCPVNTDGQEQLLASPFAASPPLSWQGYMFDVEALSNVSINSFDFEVVMFGMPLDIEVWTTKDGGSYVGKEHDPNEWQLVESIDFRPFLASSPGLSLGIWTPVPMSLDVLLLAGMTRGFYVSGIDAGKLFGNPAPIVGNIHASDGNIALKSGRSIEDFRAGAFYMPAVQVHYNLHGPFAKDIALSKIVTPSNDPLSCMSLTNSESLTVELLNLGTNPINIGDVIPLHVSLNGGPTITEFLTLSTAVAPNASFTYTFNATFDLSNHGSYLFDVSHSQSLDAFPSNNSISTEIDSGGEGRVTKFPWFEDFSGRTVGHRLIPPVGWAHEFGGPLEFWEEWQFSNGLFAGNSTRPSADHTTGINGLGNFAHTNDGGEHAAVSLQSPCIELDFMANPRLGFWLHSDSHDSLDNLFHVDLIDVATGAILTDIIPPIGHLGPQWTQHLVDLTPYMGTVFRLVFRASTDHGGTAINQTDHEFALDDVAIFDLKPVGGQQAQLGFASLEIGETVNGLAAPVQSGEPGPFYASATVGESLVFEFSGEPWQPVIMLTGPLNPFAATFPLIGGLDVGGAVDPSTGIPTSILIAADGNSPIGINAFFNTGSTGDGAFGVTVPNFPPGLLTTFQCVLRTSGSNGAPIALSNAVSLLID
jgi:hypothetical protein